MKNLPRVWRAILGDVKKLRTARPKRIAHNKQKPKPRLVSKAHRLERDENQAAFSAAERIIERTERDPRKRKGAETPAHLNAWRSITSHCSAWAGRDVC
jgi:hypothetical protein